MKNSLNRNIIIILAVIFSLLFVFGISCIVSKYISINQNRPTSVFGCSVMEITNDKNAPVFRQGDNVVIINKEAQVGDFVTYDGAGNFNSDEYFGRVEFIYKDKVIIKPLNYYQIVEINKDRILGVASTSNNFVCGLVNFLLSNWILWLFVIIPCVVLIILIIVIAFLNLTKSINVPQDILHNTKQDDRKIETSNENKVIKKKKIVKNIKVKEIIDDRKQLTINFDLLEDKKKQDATNIAESKNNLKKQKSTKNNETFKIKTSKPKIKNTGDDYIYKPLPPADTNKPIKAMLLKITKEQNDNKKLLLEKMRNSK